MQFVRVLYCKLPTNGKQLPAFPFEAVPGIEPRPQRWEAIYNTTVCLYFFSVDAAIQGLLRPKIEAHSQVTFTPDRCETHANVILTSCTASCQSPEFQLVGSPSMKCGFHGDWTFSKRPCCISKFYLFIGVLR